MIIKAYREITKLSNKVYILSTLFDAMIFGAGIFLVFKEDGLETLPIIGWLIIGVSAYICFKVRYNKKLFFLFMVLCFINISLGISDCINMGLYVSNWQLPLRATVYNSYTAKSILLFLITINLILSKTWIRKKAFDINNNYIKRKNNIIISFIGLIALYLILLFGSNGSSSILGGYVSNNNPIYEYSIVVFVATWYYSNENRKAQVLLEIFAICYVIFSLYQGDRSAAFLMLFLYYILNYENKISIFKLIILALFALLISNSIGVMRSSTATELGVELLKSIFERGFHSDTVSYSYYASISVTALHHIEGDTLLLFSQYVKSIFLGSNESSNLTSYASINYKELFNYNGGIYSSYFYCWFGFLGVFIGAIMLGTIIRKVYSKQSSTMYIYQVLIPVFSLRWYLYGPTSLFRGILLLTTLLLVICAMFDGIFKKQQKGSEINSE